MLETFLGFIVCVSKKTKKVSHFEVFEAIEAFNTDISLYQQQSQKVTFSFVFSVLHLTGNVL